MISGAALGLVTSLLLAWGLVQFLPTNIAGNTREKLEGIVGLFAVLMMLLSVFGYMANHPQNRGNAFTSTYQQGFKCRKFSFSRGFKFSSGIS